MLNLVAMKRALVNSIQVRMQGKNLLIFWQQLKQKQQQ